LAKGFLSLWGLGFLWVVTSFLKPPRSRSDIAERVIRAGSVDSIAVGDAKLVQHGSEPIWLVRLDEETFVGLSGVCTHFRCILEWAAEEKSLVCPCHDGAFDLNGNVLKGPPPRALKRYRVRTQLGEIYVHV
jgi:cytochrome b6-f complex iron-sulfur subunit